MEEAHQFASNQGGKLGAMSGNSNRIICPHCLSPTRSEGGHKQCQMFSTRTRDHFQAYVERNTEHSLRITPWYLVEFIRLNSNIPDDRLQSITPHIAQIFQSYFQDLYNYLSIISNSRRSQIQCTFFNLLQAPKYKSFCT